MRVIILLQSTIDIIITIEGIRTNKEKGVNLDPPFSQTSLLRQYIILINTEAIQ